MQPEFLSLSRSGKQRSGAENRKPERKTEIRSGNRRIKWENILELTGIGEKQM